MGELTLAMIVKDEERCLDRCLGSVAGLADRIVILDTGSTDRTVEIAESHGAEVHRDEWPGAFDEARNRSLAHVHTPWVLWLDADEWLADDTHEPIRELMARSDAFGFRLIRRNLMPDGRYAEMPMLRLWRHHPELRFRGVVHEHLPLEEVNRLFPDLLVFYTDIPFWHDAYAFESLEEQSRKYLPALRRELEIRPGQLYYEVHLARALTALGEPEGDIIFERIEERILDSEDETPDPYVENALIPLLKRIPESELRAARADRLIRYARGWLSDRPLILWTLAELEIKRGSLLNAFHILRELEALSRQGTSRATVFPEQREALWTNLALVAHQLGRKEIARINYERLLSLDPNHPVATQNLRLL